MNLDNLFFNEKIKLNKKIDLIFYKPIKSKLFKYFLGYLLSLCFLISFVEFKEKRTSSINEIKNNTVLLKKDLKFKSLTKIILPFYNIANKNSLKIISLSLKNSKLLFTLKAKKKDNIYKFLENMKNVKFDNISYDNNIKRYFANGNLKIYRR